MQISVTLLSWRDMFLLVIFGVLFLYSATSLEYYDEDADAGFKSESGTPTDVDYISGIFGDRQNPDGNIVLTVFVFLVLCNFIVVLFTLKTVFLLIKINYRMEYISGLAF